MNNYYVRALIFYTLAVMGAFFGVLAVFIDTVTRQAPTAYIGDVFVIVVSVYFLVAQGKKLV
jgi:hypothetical protein